MIKKARDSVWIMVYGCIWGLLEVTLGSFLHFIHFPQKGTVMGAVAYTIMLTYLLKHKGKLWHPIYLGIIAASFKAFNVFIFRVPIFSRAIVNPALAIIAEAISVTVGAYIVVYVVKVFKLKQHS